MDTDYYIERGNPSSKDIMSNAGARVFNSNLWSCSNSDSKIPSWFPQPHYLWQRANSLTGKYSLAPLEKATYSWIPPYTILLNGKEETLAQ